MPRKFIPLLIAAALPLAVLSVGPTQRPPLLVDGPEIAMATSVRTTPANFTAAIEACLNDNAAAIVRADATTETGRDVTCQTKL
jgi:hypothetical protein